MPPIHILEIIHGIGRNWQHLHNSGRIPPLGTQPAVSGLFRHPSNDGGCEYGRHGYMGVPRQWVECGTAHDLHLARLDDGIDNQKVKIIGGLRTTVLAPRQFPVRVDLHSDGLLAIDLAGGHANGHGGT